MQELPHNYLVAASAETVSHVTVSSPGLDDLETAAPAEFGGPGDAWSPETLLTGSVANCFILTFRAIARHSKLDWLSLRCTVRGVLDRVERVTQFTDFYVEAELTVPAGTDEQKALRLMEKAEHGCLVTNSMKATSHLEAVVRSAEEALATA